jgi:hypothetical protein
MSKESIAVLPPEISEARGRRARTLDTIQGQTAQYVAETTSVSLGEALEAYQVFLSTKVIDAWLYVQTGSPSLSKSVQEDKTTPWLDNVLSLQETTIREYIVAQLGSPVE